MIKQFLLDESKNNKLRKQNINFDLKTSRGGQRQGSMLGKASRPI